ncbi:MAG TPA: hypothetical protein VKJ45_03015, partial [Blastocatellia bacterium]|nr:hypothetical protein [Blastocatellia bacterium]
AQHPTNIRLRWSRSERGGSHYKHTAPLGQGDECPAPYKHSAPLEPAECGGSQYKHTAPLGQGDECPAPYKHSAPLEAVGGRWPWLLTVVVIFE